MILAALCAAGCSKKSSPSESTANEAPNAEAHPRAPVPGKAAPGAVPSKSCDEMVSSIPSAERTKCTRTEEILYEKDPTGECLRCAFKRVCLDDKKDHASECGDPIGSSGPEGEALCLATLACELGVDPAMRPAPAQGLVSNAYCGDTPTMQCIQGGAKGACMKQIAAGLPSDWSTKNGGLDVLRNISNDSYPSGRAGGLVACIIPRGPSSGGCATCFN